MRKKLIRRKGDFIHFGEKTLADSMKVADTLQKLQKDDGEETGIQKILEKEVDTSKNIELKKFEHNFE